ncbi:MAG: hypothetical protein AB8G05_04650 [Oligoflexales bacterium]
MSELIFAQIALQEEVQVLDLEIRFAKKSVDKIRTIEPKKRSYRSEQCESRYPLGDASTTVDMTQGGLNMLDHVNQDARPLE